MPPSLYQEIEMVDTVDIVILVEMLNPFEKSKTQIFSM